MESAPPGDASTTDETFSFGTATSGLPGNFYKVCWGYNPTSLSDYNVVTESARACSYYSS